MAKKIRKQTAKPALTQEWFRRYQQGESPPAIAEKDHYDVRTVRKYIEQYRQEVETKEAKATVLRNALERHYDDLRSYAEMLNSRYFGVGRVEPMKDAEFMESALRQHLPRSPIWSYLSKLSNLDKETTANKQQVYENIEKEVKASSEFNSIVAAGHKEVINNVIEALKYQVDRWSHGEEGLNLKDHLTINTVDTDKFRIMYGSIPIIEVEEKWLANEYLETIRNVLENIESRIKQRDELLLLIENISDTARIKRKLKEELAVIRLKRIVPGHCKYCPL